MLDDLLVVEGSGADPVQILHVLLAAGAGPRIGVNGLDDGHEPGAQIQDARGLEPRGLSLSMEGSSGA